MVIPSVSHVFNFMYTLSLFYILAIAVLYFKERYTVEAILIKLNINENNY